MTVSSIFKVSTFAPIAKLYGNLSATVVRPFAQWAANLPAGYVFAPEYDGIFNGTTRLANPSAYWTTDSVEYIPIDMSTAAEMIRNASWINTPHFRIGVFGSANIQKFRDAYCVVIDGKEHRVGEVTPIRQDWAEITLVAQ